MDLNAYPGMTNNIWNDTLDVINVPIQNHIRESVKMHFIDKGANTPLQFIAQLITVLFTHDGSPLDEKAFKILLRRYKDYPDADRQRHIRRTLFALINYTDVQLNINMMGYDIYMSDFDEFERYLDGIDASAGGNKKKRSAKRKSSKKRSTRSKK